MIGLFAICSLAPVLLFASFAYQRTRTQLEANAVRNLRRETKSDAMRIVDRFTRAAEELRRSAALGRVEGAARERPFYAISRVPIESVALTPAQRMEFERAEPILIEDELDGSRPFKLLLRADRDSALLGSLDSNAIFAFDQSDRQLRTWIENANGRVLLASDLDDDTQTRVGSLDRRRVREALVLDGPSGREIAMRWPIFLRGCCHHDGLFIGVSIPLEVVFEPLAEFETAFVAAIGLALFGTIGLALDQIRRRIAPLDELLRAVHAIESGDYEARAIVRSGDEFENLAQAFNTMSSEVSAHVTNLRRLTTSSSALLQDPSTEAVAARLIEQALQHTGVDCGALLQRTAHEATDACEPPPCRVLVAARQTADGVRTEELATLDLPIQNATSGESVVLERETHADRFATAWSTIERLAQTRIESLLVLPLRTGGGPITTQLVLASSAKGASSPWRGRISHSVRILADQAAVALRISELVTNLRTLFEGIIHLTVQAIDEKSPYTGEHCRRVPILTEQIADAVDRTSIGRYKDFRLTSEERYELRIAALLHDCGKVATPVHVMDKATKLEAIMDRIAVVRDRAEILRRDLELAGLRAELERLGHGDPVENRIRDEAQAAIEADLAFLESCNIGGERMSPEARARVDAIDARWAWVDRKGATQRWLTEQDRENLKIGRGTLNSEERAVIERHATTTIRLLERLPFPPEMARVPAIAGAHHEHMDGTGYPKGLRREQLDAQSRILGLADVFEALTAKDRPYKPGRTLSQSIEILRAMANDGHIDGELLEIMLEENVHIAYAAAHLAPEQIDEEHREALERWTAPWGTERSSAIAD